MDLKILDLGLVDYPVAWKEQKEILARVINNTAVSTLILCQHHSVITLGRKKSANSFKLKAEAIENKGIRLFDIDRGGDITYHGPGQITAYPIFDLKQLRQDIHWFLRLLEEIIIDSLSDFSLIASRIEGLTGVWIGEKKIASIGIAVKHWVTYHGMSINLKKSDTSNFDLIRPCGMDIKMTSLEECLGRPVNLEDFKKVLIDKFRNKINSSGMAKSLSGGQGGGYG